MIQIRSRPDQRILELGGGSQPLCHPTVLGGRDVNVDVRMCYDAEGRQTTDFTASFEEPLPIQSGEFDAVLSQYCLEHISWRKVRQLLAECFRVLKSQGRLVLVTPNTDAQMQWIKDHPEGWDDKPIFESASCILYGDQDYEHNTHRSYISPIILTNMLMEAGFVNIRVTPYGARNTDMVAEAVKPNVLGTNVEKKDEPYTEQEASLPPKGKIIYPDMKKHPDSVFVAPSMSREEMFDKSYFNGGGKVGGYAREGYRDFPVHHITAQHVLERNPESVLELGAARGYILKRIQDAGVYAEGMEISKHCYMTRVCEGIQLKDLCQTPWEFPRLTDNTRVSGLFDLCISVAVLEHIPEQYLPAVIAEMKRVSKRGLHGIDFGEHDDGFDRTHCTIRNSGWWIEQFAKYAPDWPVEIVDKETLEQGYGIPAFPFMQDGLRKLNLGSHTVMTHYGWLNIDVHDLAGFAQANGYQYLRHDVRGGIPFATETVDMIHMSHVLEHFSYSDGLALLRECRRAIRPNGVIRIAVPDAAMLQRCYQVAVGNGDEGDLKTLRHTLSDYDEINDECATSPTPLGKLWSLLHAGHQAAYDAETLCLVLKEASFIPEIVSFRQTEAGERGKRLLKESTDMFPCLSLYVEGLPLLGNKS